MKRFVKSVLFMLGLIFVGLGLIISFHFYIIGSQYKYNYQASILDKVARLESIDEPKIILVGNSNLSFGIDSEMIQEKTHMPVVNMGLHGALGNEFHERMGMLDIDEGDIVVVCHTSYGDDDTIGDATLAWITFDCHSELLSLFRFKDIIELAKAYPSFFRKAFFFWISGRGNKDTFDIYSRDAFNEYGDVVYKPDYGNLDGNSLFEKSYSANRVARLNDTCINRLNKMNEYVNSKGASMVIASYPIGYGQYSLFTEKDFQIFQEELKAKLECDVISDFTDYFFPYDYFYNTDFHLDEYGTKVRSAQLADDICDWIERNNK